MASKINFNNINGDYPIAGQDNDSQGFRDNFTNIKNNLRFASEELTDLQNKVLLKSALLGSSLQNDLNYTVLVRPKLKATAQEFRDLGTATGSLGVSFLDAELQKVTTGGPLTVALTDFPPTGTYGKMRLWLSIVLAGGQTSATVTFPAQVTLGLGTFTNITVLPDSTKQFEFDSSGDHMFEISTADGGTNFWLINL